MTNTEVGSDSTEGTIMNTAGTQTTLPFLAATAKLTTGMSEINSESSLVGLALALGARSVKGWHLKEAEVAEAAEHVRGMPPAV